VSEGSEKGGGGKRGCGGSLRGNWEGRWVEEGRRDHGLINYIDSQAKCHLKKFTCKGTLRQVFIRVYTLNIQSVKFVFSAQLCELLPLSPCLWFNSPPLPLTCVNKCTCIQCVKGGVWESGPQTDEHLPQSPFTGKFLWMTTFCIAFYESYLSTEERDG
jgi:hypothetical protein